MRSFALARDITCCKKYQKRPKAYVFCEHFIEKIRKIMIKEKACIKSDQMYIQFVEKWKDYTAIYDCRGPDLNIIF